MTGTAGSYSRPRRIEQVVFASTGLTAGTATRIPTADGNVSAPADYVVPETGLYAVVVDTRATMATPGGSSGRIVAFVTVDGVRRGGTEHMPQQINNTTGTARAENAHAGINFLVNLTAGQTVGLSALLVAQTGSPNGSIQSTNEGWTRLLIERVA